MALPPGILPKTVTLGIASFADGSLAGGRATISMPVNVLHVPTNRPIFSSDLTQPFVDGAASFNLLPTDAPGLNRVDWAYKLRVEVSGAAVQPEVIYFVLPSSGPDVVDLDGLVTVPSSAGIPISVTRVTSVAGLVGDVSVAQLSAAGVGGSGDVTALASVVATKADSATVSSGLAQKVNSSTYVAGLAGKADLVSGLVPDMQLPARLADVALRAALVPFWTPAEVLTAGAIRVAPDGTTIQRNANGTARSAYDATEAALWTVSGGGSVDLVALNNRFVPRRFDIRDYGAKMDGVRLTDAVTTAAAAAVSSASRSFTSADVGKTIGVVGAGPTARGKVLVSTIVSVTGGVATMADNATAAVTGASCTFGTPDDAAFLAAEAAANAAVSFGLTGGTVFVPPGRTVVTQAITTHNYVSWSGVNRDISIVSVIKVGGTWLTKPNIDPTTPLIGAVFERFKIEAELHTGTSYSSQLKPFDISNVKHCVVRDMWLADTPATSIPFDYSQDQNLVAHNLITNPGRMASGVGPGGSGIGLGTFGGDAEPTLVIGNSIIGPGSAAVAANGVNGIFVESQKGTAETATTGYRITGNYVRGMTYGITDAGGRGSVITGNVCEGNVAANMVLNAGTFSPGMPGVDALIANNSLIGAVSGGHGLLIDVSQTGRTAVTVLRALITGNYISKNDGRGVAVLIDTVDVTGLVVTNNVIRESGLSGLSLLFGGTTKSATIRNPQIVGNFMVNNGLRQVSSDRCGIRVEVPVVNAAIDNNRTYDDQASQTQTYGLWLAAAATYTGGTFRHNKLRGNLTGAVNIIAGGGWGLGAVVEGNVGYSFSSISSVSVGASPFTYTAGEGAEDVYIDGGTVTAIAKSGVTLYASTGRLVRLRAGESLTVTFSAAPTVVTDRVAPSPTAVPPTALTITTTPGDGQVLVSASGGAGTGLTYALYRATTVTGTPIATSFPFTDTGRTNGTAVTYVATATNASGTVTSNTSTATPAVGATPAATYLDTFTGANGTAITGRALSEGSSSATWLLDGVGGMVIGANMAVAGTTSTSGGTHQVFDSGLARRHLKATVGALLADTAKRKHKLEFRYQDTSNYWRIATDTGVYVMTKIIAGTATALITSTVVPAVGDVVEVDDDSANNAVKMFINGAPVGATITDTALASASKVGISGQYYSTAVLDPTSAWTDFAVYSS